MTVSTAPTPLSYSGNGATTSFPISWKYNAKSHVVATLRSSAGVETVWALTTNYTLTDPGDTGTLTALVAPATGETLVITLEPPNTQSSDIPLGGDFPSVTVEDGLDLSAQRDAKIEALFLRALRVPKTDTQTGSLLEIPIDSLRASKFLGFDANGKPIAAAGTSANLGPVSTYVETLLDDPDAKTFRQTQLLDKKGADIASTATINLDTSTGDLVDVTGTTAITAITLAEGVEKTVRFTGILLLTHSASLVLPGGASITTAAGDFSVFRGYASGVVRCVQYVRATGVINQIVKRKTADESVTSSVTLQDDDHLTFAIAANEEWIANFYLSVGNALNNTGIKVSVTSPSGSTLEQNALFTSDAAAAGDINALARRSVTSGAALEFTTAIVGVTIASGFIHLSYWVLNGATPGNITLQFSQSTSNGNPTNIRKGSHMLATRVA